MQCKQTDNIMGTSTIFMNLKKIAYYEKIIHFSQFPNSVLYLLAEL